MKLHLGCGNDIKPGFMNVDFENQPGVDVVLDLETSPWPFEDNSVDQVITNHTLEHIDQLQRVMKELHRVCRPGCIIKISVPHFSCGVSYRDPTHKRLFSYFTFDYFCDNSPYYKRKEKGLFEIAARKLNFTRLSATWLNRVVNPLINLCPSIYERLFCWILPTSEVIFELRVVK